MAMMTQTMEQWEADQRLIMSMMDEIERLSKEVERLRLFEIYSNGDIEAQVEAAIEAKKLTGKYPFED